MEKEEVKVWDQKGSKGSNPAPKMENPPEEETRRTLSKQGQNLIPLILFDPMPSWDQTHGTIGLSAPRSPPVPNPRPATRDVGDGLIRYWIRADSPISVG